MSAQRMRLEAASANLANANSTRAENGQPYERRDVSFAAIDVEDDWRINAQQRSIFDSGPRPQGVRSEVFISEANQSAMQYMPASPEADANGYVRMPDVDPIEETVNMISAARSFEANATVFNTAKDLAKVSLNLGDA